MPQPTFTKRFHIRIELKEIEPKIWRELIVPSDISLGWLHEVIQITMGWDNDHMHEFRHKGVSYGSNEILENGDLVDEDTVSLDDLFKRKGSRLTYIYDFGDGWTHEVSLVTVLKLSAQAAAETPHFAYLGGGRACPPEDCGGPWGYLQILEILELKKQQGEQALDANQREFLDWLEEFDPNAPPARVTIERQLGKIGRWQAEADPDVDWPDDLAAFEKLIHEVRADLIRDFEQSDHEDEEPIPEPYSQLSADEASAYAVSLKLAAQVRDAEPWKTLADADIFGIEDPDTGELDIVSMLGAAGQVFAVHVHRPPLSLHFWKQALSEPEGMTEDFVLKNSRLIEAEFVNVQEMEPYDLELYRQTGHERPGKGRQRGIRLRTYAPRLMPAFGHLSDLPALNRGFRLGLRFLEWIKENGIEALPDPFAQSLPVFRFEGDQTSDPSHWSLTQIPVDWESCEPPSKVYSPSEFEIAQLAAYPMVEETWETAAVYLPTPVATKDGPVICVVAAVASHAAGAAAPVPHLDSEPKHNAARVLWNSLAEAVDRAGYLPAELHVSSEHAFDTFRPLAKTAGIRLKQFERCDLVGPLLHLIALMPPPGAE